MDITQVKVFPVNEDKLKAFVSVVFDHCFMVNDIKIIQGKDGLFLSMPSRRKRSGEFKDVAHPLNNETRRLIEERVLAEYRNVADDTTPRRPDRDDAEERPADEAPRPRPVAVPEPEPTGSRPVAVPAAAAQQAPAREPEPLPAAAAPPPEAARPAAAVARDDGDAAGEKTLEEVQEMHLSDSFWSVT